MRSYRFAYYQTGRKTPIIAEAKPGTKYTRTKIQEEFLRELEAFPELKPAVRNALHTSQKTKNNTPFDLEGWAMEEIRLALGEYVQTRPGRDRESWISAQISQLCEIFFAAHHTTRHFLII